MFIFHPLRISYIKMLEELSMRGISKKYISEEQEDFMRELFGMFDIQIKFSRRGVSAHVETEIQRRNMVYYITMLKKFEHSKEYTFPETIEEDMKTAMFKTLEYFNVYYSYDDIKVRAITKTHH